MRNPARSPTANGNAATCASRAGLGRNATVRKAASIAASLTFWSLSGSWAATTAVSVGPWSTSTHLRICMAPRAILPFTKKPCEPLTSTSSACLAPKRDTNIARLASIWS